MATRKKQGDNETEKKLSRRAEAETLVANAVQAVVRQRKIAATLRRRGLNASDAEERLAQLERKLSEFERELASIFRNSGAQTPESAGSLGTVTVSNRLALPTWV
jgi:hypothetical protein